MRILRAIDQLSGYILVHQAGCQCLVSNELLTCLRFARDAGQFAKSHMPSAVKMVLNLPQHGQSLCAGGLDANAKAIEAQPSVSLCLAFHAPLLKPTLKKV